MKTTYGNSLDELAKLSEDIEAYGRANGLSDATVHAFQLCLDEVFTNIVNYAFEDDDTHSVELEMTCEGDVVQACIADDGKPFDPLANSTEPDLDVPLEDRAIGGLGIFFLQQFMDELAYRREDDRNILTLRKRKDAGPHSP